MMPAEYGTDGPRGIRPTPPIPPRPEGLSGFFDWLLNTPGDLDAVLRTLGDNSMTGKSLGNAARGVGNVVSDFQRGGPPPRPTGEGGISFPQAGPKGTANGSTPSGSTPKWTETTTAGYLDPYRLRDPKTGAPTGFRPGAPEYAKAPPVPTVPDKAKAAGATSGTGGGARGGGAVSAGPSAGGAPPVTVTKAPTAPSATGWEEEFYRTHGRFPTEWDWSDKEWSVGLANQLGRPPTRQEWVNHAMENRFNPQRPATQEFAPGWGLDTGFGPNRPAPMSAVPAQVQIPGQKPGVRFDTPRGAPRSAGFDLDQVATSEGRTAREIYDNEAVTQPRYEGNAKQPQGEWGQLIPQSWSTKTTNEAFGQWLAEGGSGEPAEWAEHLQAIGAE